MTKTEVRDELDGIQYMISAIQDKLTDLVNQSCVNPSFRTRLHKVEDKLYEASDHIHFARHIIYDLIYADCTREY